MSVQRTWFFVSSGVLSAGVLATALFFGATPGLHADDDHAKCQRRDLNAETERCWSEYHGYWSGADHRWHTERDWDHDDHDRDHDRPDDQR